MLKTWLIGLMTFGLGAGTAAAQSAPAQSAPASPADSAQEPPSTTVDDVVVVGGALEKLAEEFVNSLAAPARYRGLARWDTEVCLGVVNFRTGAAHQLIDHISDVAREIGVELGEPGCEPNAVIVGTTDGRALASELVDRRRRAFRFGYTRSNRGARALDTFRTTDAPVRWWHISLLFDTTNGELAIRVPGGPMASVPCLQRRGGVRQCNEVTDRLVRTVIIVDLEALPELSFTQLGDYLSVLALAQVEPEMDYGAFDTVLNVIKDPASATGLTDWDMNYLRALYSGESERVDPDEQAAELVERMRQADAE